MAAASAILPVTWNGAALSTAKRPRSAPATAFGSLTSIARHSTGVVAFRRSQLLGGFVDHGDLVVAAVAEQVGDHLADLAGAHNGYAFHRDLIKIRRV